MKRSDRHSPQATKVFEHIRELRIRLTVSLIALVAAGIGVYLLYEPLFSLIRAPLDAPLYYSTPAGSFAFVMKICLMGALTVTIPVIIYNLIMFIRPAFKKVIPLRRVYLTTLFSAMLALCGVAFGFAFIIPGALHFFAGFQTDGLSALISADSYLGFVTNVVITFILVFQLPLVIAFIDTITPLTPKKLLSFEKWVILGSLIISFLVPFALDITTSLLIALPIVVLYNLSILIVMMQHARAKRHARALARKAQRIRIPALPSPSSLPVSSMSLTDLSYESLISEPVHKVTARPEPAIVTPTAPTISIVQTMTAAKYTPAPRAVRGPVMDIRRVSSPPAVIVPPARARAASTSFQPTNVRLISDFGRS